MISEAVCPPKLKVRTPGHAKKPGWYVELESRVTQDHQRLELGQPLDETLGNGGTDGFTFPMLYSAAP